MASAQTIPFGKGLDLPRAVSTSVISLLGQRGRGKTSTAKVLVEGMLDAGTPVIILDTVGVWWGLRLNKAGTGSSGLNTPILGGHHGDAPLLETAGEVVAKALVATRSSAILDFTLFPSEAATKRFMVDFATAFFRAKMLSKYAVHLVLEEADDWVPQDPTDPNDFKLLGIFGQIARKGRNFGIGFTTITLRPQGISKKLLNLSEILMIFGLTANLERKAVEAWMKDQEVGAEEHRQAMDLLPRLGWNKYTRTDGGVLVWSPLLSLFKVAHLNRPRTFDSSRTPENDDAIDQHPVQPLDLGALQEAMASTFAEAEASDPSRLRRRISELEAELRKSRASTPAPDPQALERARAHGELVATKRHSTAAVHVCGRLRLANARLAEMLPVFEMMAQELEKSAAATQPTTVSIPPPGRSTAPTPAPRIPVPAVSGVEDSSNGMPPMERKMLLALAQHPEGLTKRQVLIHATYAAGGATSRAFATLAREGWSEQRGERLVITAAGLDKLGAFDPLPIGAELREHLLRTTAPMESKILAIAFDVHPATVGKGEILNRAGYAAGGATSRAFAKLTRLGYVVKSGNGLRAAPELFE